MNTEVKPKSNRKKAILISLGVVATAVGGFFGFNYLRKRKNQNDSQDDGTTTDYTSTQTTTSTYTAPKTTTAPVRNDDFPLKKGSKGDRVKAFQTQLIAKYGKTILPKYGADGDFGSEMVAALKKIGLSETIDESTYNVYVTGAAPDATDLASKLYQAATDKNYSNAISYLKQIRNTTDYSAVSDQFKTYRIGDGVRKTLVTGMLDTFNTSTQQQGIRLEFLRMGLKYDGTKWSLSGIPEGRMIITTQPTEVVDPKHQVKVKVPNNMVLGYFLKEKSGLTLFKSLTKNKKLIVKTSTVKFHA